MNARLYKKLEEYIEGLLEAEKIILWNEYCEANNYYDDMIYDLADEVDEILYEKSPSEVISMVVGEDLSRPYFRSGVYFETGDLDDFFDIQDLIQYIVRSYNYLNDYDIRNILEEEEK